MKYINDAGEVIYMNVVNKGYGERWVMVAVSGQKIIGRDGQKTKSRTFKQDRNAEAYLKKHGYKCIG